LGELLNFIAPFFATPTNYAEMLKKLAGFAFYQALLISLLLRQIPQVDAGLRSLEASVPFASGYELGAVLIALLAALISHVLPLHDRISDLFQIRQRFDTQHIMLPLAGLVGAKLTPEGTLELTRDRHRLMREVFYKFASSRDPSPLVDRHDIEHALSQWAWFWAFIEGIIFWAIGAAVAFAFKAISLGCWFLVIALLLLLIALAFSRRLPRYARPQIEAIAADSEAAKHVKSVFDALQD
jgi:hypothetical protein